jgi:GAF domain-containing protein
MANGEDTVDYTMLRKQLEALLSGESDVLANTANFVALLNEGIDRINWVGVYVLRGDELVLGPFQGKPACVRLPLGQGVCGTAARKRQTLRIADVHAFDGHIACDSASNSELVVPLILGNNVIGVLDIDSPIHDRFTANDQIGIEALCRSFVQVLEAPGGSFI